MSVQLELPRSNAMKPIKPPANKWPRKCRTKFCRHSVWKHHKSPFCSKCTSKRYRERYPLHRRYYHIKYTAKARLVAFLLSREQFVAWCRSVGYSGNGGKTADCPSVDRIDPKRGYEVGNLQLLTVGQNSRKSFIERKLMAYYGETVS